MKRRTFISLMGVMAAAGVLGLTGCSSKDTARQYRRFRNAE